MLRTLLLAAVLAIPWFTACHHDPQPMTPGQGELPPLPPSSGTPIGYLIDNAPQLELKDDQVVKLKEIDRSLAARNDGIDTQLREIEKPDEEQAEKGKLPPRYNNAPGKGAIKTTSDAGKLHDAHSANDRAALEQAFALLEPKQQEIARKLLDDRGISSPGSPPKAAPEPEGKDGVPLEP